MDDSVDYEIVSQKDLDGLRREISAIKKNPFGDSTQGRDIIDAMARLEETIRKLTRILEDAQTDIIREYQDAKPAEKLNQLLDQNETIARALLTINDSVKQTQEQLRQVAQSPQQGVQTASITAASLTPQPLQPPASSSLLPPQFPQAQGAFGQQSAMQSPQSPQPPLFNPQVMPGYGQQSFTPPPSPQSQLSQSPGTLPSFDNLPPLDSLPPLDQESGVDMSGMAVPPKKKFGLF